MIRIGNRNHDWSFPFTTLERDCDAELLKLLSRDSIDESTIYIRKDKKEGAGNDS